LETIAVYWENKIKTYGFQTEHELSLFQISIPPHDLAGLGTAFFDDISGINFSWVLVQQSPGHVFRVHILLNQKWKQPMQALLERYQENGIGLELRTESPVEMIFFHGPHFGDRYGIADTAFRTLRGKSVPIIAAGCTGASVYIILPEHCASKARDFLSVVFKTPKK
jgi:aspartokinase